MGRVTTFLIAGIALGFQTAAAQDWIATALPERSFDFGTVARGSKILHSFKLLNRTNQEIHIADWRTKCGCTEVRVGARDIPPGTQTVIEAVLDTTKFQGYKASGLTLVIDRPSLRRGRPEPVLFHPGRDRRQSRPGRFRHRPPRQQTHGAVLTMNYNGGRPDFAVARMQTRTGDVTAKVQRVIRGELAVYPVRRSESDPRHRRLPRSDHAVHQ